MNRQPLQNLLTSIAVITIACIASIASLGFQYGISNNIFHIPYVLKYDELPQFYDDAFIQSLKNFTSIVWPFFRETTTEKNIESAFFIGHILSRTLALHALLWLFKSNCPSKQQPAFIALIAISICPWLMNSSAVGGHGIFITYFTHSEVTWGPLIYALIFAQSGRLRLAAFFTAIVFLINAFIGIWLALALAIPIIASEFKYSPRNWKKITQSTAILIITSSPVLIWISLAITKNHGAVDFSYIEYIRYYYPEHFLIESTPINNLRNLLVITYCGFLAITFGQNRQFWSLTLMSLVGLLLAGAVLPYIADKRFIFNLHLLRSAGLLQFIAVALTLLSCINIATEDQNSTSTRLMSVLAALLLVTREPEPTALFGCAALLTIIALKKYCQRRCDMPHTFNHKVLRSIENPYFPIFITATIIGIEVTFFWSPILSPVRWGLALATILTLTKLKIPTGTRENIVLALWASFSIFLAKDHADSRKSGDNTAPTETATNYIQLTNWIKSQDAPGPYLLPTHGIYKNQFNDFQLLTKKTIWANWKQGAAAMWEPSFYSQWKTRLTQTSKLTDSKSLLTYASDNRIPFIVLPKNMGRCEIGYKSIFENTLYSVCSTSVK